MSTQNKKGFTLIELMVVIVIIGILAAVAIPKLFGMSAKAKASELTAAAGTWAKLIQAYAFETNNNDASTNGSFTKIGFDRPNPKNKIFTYEDESKGVFLAKNVDKMNECEKDNLWTATFGTDGSITTNIGGEDGKNEGCQSLTPNFDKIETAVGGSSNSGGSGDGS